jgi:hypothetical protein
MPAGKSLPVEAAKHNQHLKSSKTRNQERLENTGRNVVAPLQASHPEPLLRRNNLQRSSILEKVRSEPEKSSPNVSSLPQLETSPDKSAVNLALSSSGYFTLYKIKQKRFQDKGYRRQ